MFVLFANISKAKTGPKLNAGLSPDFSVHLKVSLSKGLSKSLKSKSEIAHCHQVALASSAATSEAYSLYWAFANWPPVNSVYR